MRLYYQSPKFFRRAGVFLQYKTKRLLIIPVPSWFIL